MIVFIFRQILIYQVWAILFSGCASFSEEKPQVPEITPTMAVDQAVSIAIEHGGDSVEQLKARFKSSQEKQQMAQYIEKSILENQKLTNIKFIRLIQLYGYFTNEISVKVLNRLIFDETVAVRQIGWRLAAVYPAEPIKRHIEEVLTHALVKGSEEFILLPEMAKAVRTNQIKSVYTLIRFGLMSKGNDEFAKTMVVLDPEQARHDFLDYLGKATIEDLRQINQSTVDFYSCLVILNFYKQNELPLFHPKISSLILFAISRNRLLADLAGEVLEREYERHGFEFALVISRLPQWIQIAYIENQRRLPTANGSTLLSHLREVSSSKTVIEEIDAVLR